MENIDEETMQKAMKALESQKKQYARQNAYIQKNFKRASVAIPKEWEPALDQALKARKETMNAFFKRLMLEEFERLGIKVEE